MIDPCLLCENSVMKIFMAILPLLLIQEEQLQLTAKECTRTAYIA